MRRLADAAALLGLALFLAAPAAPSSASDAEAVARGEYLLRAAACVACHTDEKGDGALLAGGRALKSPYGTFYSPNITPDPAEGLGAWREQDFLRALGQGRDPDGRAYYPAFPYTAYSGMSEQDMKDLWAYLQSVPPSPRANKDHDLTFPFGLRSLARLWRALYFEPSPHRPNPARDAAWNRGAYLVRHLGHCGECHTPRGWLGALDDDRYLAGTKKGPDGKKVSNITTHRTAGIGDWSETDITFFLQTGFLPDGDVAGGAMDDVIRESSSRLSDEDRAAIAVYLKSLPPLPGP